MTADTEHPNLHVSGHPLVRHKIRMLADRGTDAKLFRELVNELTSLMVYEATADLPLRPITFQTPLEQSGRRRGGGAGRAGADSARGAGHD